MLNYTLYASHNLWHTLLLLLFPILFSVGGVCNNEEIYTLAHVVGCSRTRTQLWMEIDLSAVIVKIVSRAIMDSNKNVVCLIKEAISATIKFDGSLSSD